MLEPLSKEVLQFSSPKTYQYFAEAKDIHKAYQALQILLHDTTAEFYLHNGVTKKNLRLHQKVFWSGLVQLRMRLLAQLAKLFLILF